MKPPEVGKKALHAQMTCPVNTRPPNRMPPNLQNHVVLVIQFSRDNKCVCATYLTPRTLSTNNPPKNGNTVFGSE